MVRRKIAGLLLFATAIFGTDHAEAWGPDGHAIVAAIAEARLDPAVRAQVAQLLSLDPSGAQHLDQVASWADAVRARDPTTGPWHFVDIPLREQSFQPPRDCAGGNCVVAQIPRFAGVLANRSGTPQQRLDALKFLVHFVGDIHQPLHCETDFTNFPPPEGDRGGNRIVVTYFGNRTNLHALWDGGIIDEALNIHAPPPHFDPVLSITRPAAVTLNSVITPAHAAAWAPDGLSAHLQIATVQWANESHRLAQIAYNRLPPPPRPLKWDSAYQSAAWRMVQEQLERAGIRLARILNETLR